MFILSLKKTVLACSREEYVVLYSAILCYIQFYIVFFPPFA